MEITSKAFPPVRDFTIALVITLLTTNSLNITNLSYQIVIFILGLAVVFLFLWKLNSMAKNLEILSVLYSEVLIIKVLDTLDSYQEFRLDGEARDNVSLRLFILLPTSLEDFSKIEDKYRKMKRVVITPRYSNRGFHLYGKQMDDEKIILFDTPLTWSMGVEFYSMQKKLSKRKVKSLIRNMNEDIERYVAKNYREHPNYGRLKFISLDDFKAFYE